MEISIIVRFHNEGAYLPTVMNALINQDFPKHQYEIVAVDNLSTDNSREIASNYTENLLSISDYQPGKALNRAVSQSRGKYIAVLSAHAIPSNRNWLKILYSHFQNPDVAGVYGAQLYPVNSRFLDKRDLDIFSTLEPRIEKANSDFWNANSMFPRSKWEMQQFDETVFELEDHHWTKQILPLGYEVHFEPDALVYHYGHIERIDREYLPSTPLSDKELIEKSILELENENKWTVVMRAGLTLSSLTHSAYIKQAIHALGNQLLNHEDFDVRWRMAQALGKIPDEASVDYLIKALSDQSFYPRDEAAWSLARLGHLAVDAIISRLKEFDSDILPFAALSLGRSGVGEAEETAVDLFLDEINSNDYMRQRHAVYFAGEIVGSFTSERLIAPINYLTDSEDMRLQSVCCWALGCFAEEQIYKDVDWEKIRFLSKHSPHVLTRFESVIAFGKLALAGSDTQFSDMLTGFLADQKSRVRYGAVQSLRLLMEKHVKITLPDNLQKHEDEDFGVKFELSLIDDLR